VAPSDAVPSDAVPSDAAPPGATSVVVFDVDGTLLDSALGIVAGFRHAAETVGLPAPSEETLRSDLGPPMPDVLTSLGVPPERLADGVAAYRSFYASSGMHRSVSYEGVSALLDALVAAGVRLGTATAKRTQTAMAILGLHGLADRFTVVNGTTDRVTGKAETLAETLRRLGHPAPADLDPDAGAGWAAMVGDRHSDLAAARASGITAIGVTWGYGSRAELIEAGADLLVDDPDELRRVLLSGPAGPPAPRGR